MVDLPTARQKLAELRQALAAQGPAALQTTATWETHLRIFAFGQLDAQTLTDGCRAGAIPWWEPLAAKTYFGQLDDLRTLRAAMEADTGLSTDKPDLSTTMTWGSWPCPIVEGLPPALDGAVLDQLFDWGANPLIKDFNGGSYYDKALHESPSGVIHAFLSHGAPQNNATRIRDELLAAGNTRQAGEIQQALGLGGFFTKVDNRTLMETKYISEPGRNSILRTVFNFGAQRVNEVFETQGAGSAMTSCGFDDYDRRAIDAARDTLEKLGGAPGDAWMLDKKKKAALAEPRKP